jgi:hypothetical protein
LELLNCWTVGIGSASGEGSRAVIGGEFIVDYAKVAEVGEVRASGVDGVLEVFDL